MFSMEFMELWLKKILPQRGFHNLLIFASVHIFAEYPILTVTKQIGLFSTSVKV